MKEIGEDKTSSGILPHAQVGNQVKLIGSDFLLCGRVLGCLRSCQILARGNLSQATTQRFLGAIEPLIRAAQTAYGLTWKVDQ